MSPLRGYLARKVQDHPDTGGPPGAVTLIEVSIKSAQMGSSESSYEWARAQCTQRNEGWARINSGTPLAYDALPAFDYGDN
jgi:hypothetical protein